MKIREILPSILSTMTGCEGCSTYTAYKKDFYCDFQNKEFFIIRFLFPFSLPLSQTKHKHKNLIVTE